MSSKRGNSFGYRGKGKESRYNILDFPSNSDGHMEFKVNFPFIKTNETNLLPSYYRILKTDSLEYTENELNALQIDLEKLLSAIVIRNRIFKTEVQLIDAKFDPKQSIDTPGKKKYEELIMQRELMQKKSENLCIFKRNQPKNLVPTSEAFTEITKLSIPKMSLPKNEISNRFWTTVNAYCRPVTIEDANLLDKLIKERIHEPELKIPEIGKHYSESWAESDLSLIDFKNLKKHDVNKPDNDCLELLKKAEGIANQTPGPLTQRLMLAYIEDNLQNSNHSNIQVSVPEPLGDPICIERRIRNTLIDLGILNENDLPPIESDTIIDEMKRVHKELVNVTRKNVEILKKIRENVSIELRRQDVLQELDSIDNQIIEKGNEIIGYKMLKKPIPDELVNDTKKLIEQQIELSKQADDLTPIIMKYFPTD